MYLKFMYILYLDFRTFGGVSGALSGSSAAVLEEVAEHSGGFSLEETPLCSDGVVEASVGRGMVEGASVAGLGIRSSVYEA